MSILNYRNKYVEQTYPSEFDIPSFTLEIPNYEESKIALPC